MIEIRELGNQAIEEVLQRNDFAHLAVCLDNKPYVIPIHYGYQDGTIYIFTTQGKKYEIISENPHVCLQVEEITDEKNWVSVIVEGEAEELSSENEKDLALELVTKTNPTLTPAMSVRWMDGWVRENISVFYRVTPLSLSGRATVRDSEFHESYTPSVTEGKVF